jgi:hypothetical protein
MTIDLNNAGTQERDVIPAGIICPLQMTIRPSGAGEDGYLKFAANGTSAALDCEFTVVDGPHAKRKFWERFMQKGTTDGQKDMVEHYNKLLRAIIESVRDIKPNDKSETAIAARKVESYADFNNLRFQAQLGVQPPKDGYDAKNFILRVLTPERKDWKKIEQIAAPQATATQPATGDAGATTPQQTAAPPANAVTRPMWMD